MKDFLIRLWGGRTVLVGGPRTGLKQDRRRHVQVSEGRSAEECALPPDALDTKFENMMTLGFVAEFDAKQAEHVGAFVEEALSEADALSASGSFPEDRP